MEKSAQVKPRVLAMAWSFPDTGLRVNDLETRTIRRGKGSINVSVTTWIVLTVTKVQSTIVITEEGRAHEARRHLCSTGNTTPHIATGNIVVATITDLLRMVHHVVARIGNHKHTQKIITTI